MISLPQLPQETVLIVLSEHCEDFLLNDGKVYFSLAKAATIQVEILSGAFPW